MTNSRRCQTYLIQTLSSQGCDKVIQKIVNNPQNNNPHYSYFKKNVTYSEHMSNILNQGSNLKKNLPININIIFNY